jgi:hypothetical protein
MLQSFAFAGLWDAWKDPANGEWLQTFAIITTEANELTADSGLFATQGALDTFSCHRLKPSIAIGSMFFSLAAARMAAAIFLCRWLSPQTAHSRPLTCPWRLRVGRSMPRRLTSQRRAGGR